MCCPIECVLSGDGQCSAHTMATVMPVMGLGSADAHILATVMLKGALAIALDLGDDLFIQFKQAVGIGPAMPSGPCGR